MKKILALLIFISSPYFVWSQDEEPQTFVINDVTYVITGDNTVGIYDCDMSLTEVIIPETVTSPEDQKEYTVTTVEEDAFHWCEVSKLQLPNTITEIKYAGIYSCDNLVELNIPTSLTKMGDYALAYLPMIESITIPEGVTEIPSSCFANNASMSEISLPDGITSIGNGAFYKCPLTSFTFPAECRSIGNNAFQMADKLTTVVLNEALESFGEGTFRQCTKLTSINLQDAVNLKSISDNLFVECNSLSDITIPANVETIGINAFGNTNISEYKISAENRNFIIENKAVYSADKSILYLYPPKGDETVTVADNCRGIGGGAFYGAQTRKVILPESMVAIDAYAFCESQLAEITLPDSIVYLGEQAFAGTQLVTLVLPEGLTFVSDGLCAWSKQLTSVTIPEGVRVIYNHAFQTCSALTEVRCLAAVAPYIYEFYGDEDNPFGYVDLSQTTLHIPQGSLQSYDDNMWTDLFTNIEESEPAALVPVSITPENGTYLEKIDTIKLTFDTNIMHHESDATIKLLKGSELAGEEVIPEGGWKKEISEDGKTLIFYPCNNSSLPTAIPLEKDIPYYAVIPGTIVSNGSDIFNQKIVLTYVGKEPEVSPFVPTGILPESNTEQETLGSIEITFDRPANVEVNMPEVTVMKGNPETGELIEPDGGWMAVNNSADNMTVTVFPCDYDYFISPIELEKGISYYVTIPAGIITGEGNLISEDIELVYIGKDLSSVKTDNEDEAFVVRNGNDFTISTGQLNNCRIMIYDATGKTVADIKNAERITTFSPAENGVYIIRIETEEGIRTFKVIK